jgi:hypothetical protein
MPRTARGRRRSTRAWLSARWHGVGYGKARFLPGGACPRRGRGTADDQLAHLADHAAPDDALIKRALDPDLIFKLGKILA